MALTIDECQVTDFVEHHSERNVDFEVTLNSEDDLLRLQQQPGGLVKAFKLETNLQMTNMHVFDEQGILRKFEDTCSMLRHFVDIRMGLYEHRHDHLIQTKKEKVVGLQETVNLADLVLSGQVNVMNQSQSDLQRQIDDAGWQGESSVPDATQMLLKMSLKQFTKEEVEKQRAHCVKVTAELTELMKTTPTDLWMQDLEHAEDMIRTFLDT